ncbi:hypothetical protein HPP92_014096 [Vanilla planifolia]|uniref:Uncharacterized protein n=1 Tax=Vanilla planifolia TaxID=51239 RepID=A0A835QJD3_VANPL|nr:hypothetical protein HPP92_014096 [Vanilla planifolia]
MASWMRELTHLSVLNESYQSVVRFIHFKCQTAFAYRLKPQVLVACNPLTYHKEGLKISWVHLHSSMASVFHSELLVASSVPSRKTRIASRKGSLPLVIHRFRPDTFVKLNKGRNNGCFIMADRKWRICCRNFRGEEPPVEHNPPMDSSIVEKEMVNKFFTSINNRNVTQLLELLSDDCCYEDTLFHSPFTGKQEVGRLAAKLMEAMGPNVKFVAQVFSSIGDGTAAQWFLVWKGMTIPWSQGLNDFEFSKENLISKIKGLDEELLQQPGESILKILKIISTALDKSPEDAEAILYKLPKVFRSLQPDSSHDIAETFEKLFDHYVSEGGSTKPS